MLNRFACALALSIALLGCSSSSTGSTTGTADAGGSSVGRSCSVDVECGGLKCDPVRKQCICRADTDCAAIGARDGGVGPAPFCNNFTGLCVKALPQGACIDSSACTAANTFCNPQTRACEPIREFCGGCTPDQDIQCGAGSHCVTDDSVKLSFCSKGCNHGEACVPGATCQDLFGTGDMQCWPNQTNCKKFVGCVPDSLATCDDTHPCADANQLCNVGLGVCKAKVQACSAGTICDPASFTCVNQCGLDSDCDTGKKCVNKVCQVVGTCTEDSNCPTDKVCNIGAGGLGECVNPCVSDASCAPGNLCLDFPEPDGSTRKKCQQGCLRNTDCPLDQVCEDDSGALFQATTGSNVHGLCNDQLNGKKACQASQACGTCEVCNPDQTCGSAAAGSYCKACSPSSPGDCPDPNAVCLSLHGRDSQGNVYGGAPYFCGMPCNPAGTADNTSCPAGFACQVLTGSQSGNICVPSDLNCIFTTGDVSRLGQNKCQ
jgi:hypothetical protein